MWVANLESGASSYLGQRLQGFNANMQVQAVLRLYTSLLPHLRRAALQTRPSWVGSATVEEELHPDETHEALDATIKREAAAVLNIGRVFHSEGMLLVSCRCHCS